MSSESPHTATVHKCPMCDVEYSTAEEAAEHCLATEFAPIHREGGGDMVLCCWDGRDDLTCEVCTDPLGILPHLKAHFKNPDKKVGPWRSAKWRKHQATKDGTEKAEKPKRKRGPAKKSDDPEQKRSKTSASLGCSHEANLNSLEHAIHYWKHKECRIIRGMNCIEDVRLGSMSSATPSLGPQKRKISTFCALRSSFPFIISLALRSIDGLQRVKPIDPSADPTATSKTPKSFVIKSGTVGSSVAQLTKDLRKVLEPNTASRIRERKSNRLRDFVAMSGPLGVTHLLVLSQPSSPSAIPSASASTSRNSISAQEEAERKLIETETTLNLRLIRLPRGPTLGFKVLRYSTMMDVARMARRPRAIGREFSEAPLLILSGFGGEDKQLKLMTTVFQNLFPAIHVQSMPLTSARRVVLLSYSPVTKTVDFRHYLISVRPVGVSRPIRKIIDGSGKNTASSLTLLGKRARGGDDGSSAGSSAEDSDGDELVARNGGGGIGGKKKGKKGVLDLSRAKDISDYVLRHEGMGFVTSDSEMSSGEESGEGSGGSEDESHPTRVRLPKTYLGRANRSSGAAGEKRAVRLVELGPRMEMGLLKIEEGVGEGEVLFHEIVHKSVSEANQLAKVHSQRRKLAAERRAEQNKNVEAKKAAKATAKGESAAKGEEEDEDEDEEDEDALDSDVSFDYEKSHGLPAGEDDDDMFDDDSDVGEEEEDEEMAGQSSEGESEDEEVVGEYDDEDDSDLSPIPYNSNEESSEDDLSDDEDAAPLPLPKPTPQQQKKTNSSMSFKHKGFKKQDRGEPKRALGIQLPRGLTKKETKREEEKNKKAGKGKGTEVEAGGSKGSFSMKGGFEEKERRGRGRDADRGGRGGFGGRGGRGGGRGGRGGRGRGK